MEGLNINKWYFIIDVAKCENCANCFLSCKDEHVGNDWGHYTAPQADPGPGWIEIPGVERGQYPLIDVAYLPTPCMHCENPPCLKAAENGAIYKRPDGIVMIDPVKAKGQEQIARSCPYGAIKWNDVLKLPQKCTFCSHLLDNGWGKTRCVQSCPTGALSVLKAEENRMAEIIQSEKLETYHPEWKTGPHVYYKNLYRFTRCFLAGSIAITKDSREECAEGALVSLHNDANEKVGETKTDNYGDFKFDNLVENSGIYTLSVSYTGYNTKTLTVELKKSQYTGIIHL